MMHSLIYNIELLRKMRLSFARPAFYVDNLFVFVPLKYNRKTRYANVDLPLLYPA